MLLAFKRNIVLYAPPPLVEKSICPVSDPFVTLVTSVTSVTFVMNSLVTLVISFVMNSFVILKTTGIGGGGGIRTTTEDCLNVSTTPLVR